MKLKELAVKPIPHEFAIGEVYMPPLLVAAFLGLIAAMVTARLLNRYRLTRHFFYPPLVFIALTIIYTVIIGTFIIPA
jgi:type III secretory pathway component EscS